MLKKKHILVIDDDKKLGNLLKSFLNEKGYLVDLAENTKVARNKMLNIAFDILILDVMLPVESGLTFASILRKKNNNVPIFMLSAMGDTNDRITGLKIGVDEYLSKPFEPEELLLRIENVIKRNSFSTKEINAVKLGIFHFHINERKLILNNNSIKLTTKECNVMLYLYKKIRDDVAREELAKNINVSTRSVDVLVKRLREKILSLPNSKNILLTSRGIGYRLDP
tara:strand:- start:106 stop:780 length:675 start_codon:yes stop_codon:yes gene_type:complete